MGQKSMGLSSRWNNKKKNADTNDTTLMIPQQILPTSSIETYRDNRWKFIFWY